MKAPAVPEENVVNPNVVDEKTDVDDESAPTVSKQSDAAAVEPYRATHHKIQELDSGEPAGVYRRRW